MTPPIILPFADRFEVNDFAPHFGQRTSPVSSTCVFFIPAPYSPQEEPVMAYRLTHPDSDQEIEVDAEQVSLYTSQGWRTKPSAPKPKPADDE